MNECNWYSTHTVELVESCPTVQLCHLIHRRTKWWTIQIRSSPLTMITMRNNMANNNINRRHRNSITSLDQSVPPMNSFVWFEDLELVHWIRPHKNTISLLYNEVVQSIVMRAASSLVMVSIKCLFIFFYTFNATSIEHILVPFSYFNCMFNVIVFKQFFTIDGDGDTTKHDLQIE